MRHSNLSQRCYDDPETLRLLASELDSVIAAGPAIPLEPGGWWHQYVCPEHHTELLFDELQADSGRYLCPHGCVLEGEPYHGAWLVFRHQAMARFALQAAAVHASSGERRYGDYGKGIIVAYARQFPLYPVHPDAQPWMLKGRAFHQALTEAIWATTLIRAYLLLADNGMDFDDAKDELAAFWEMLGRSMEQYHAILTVERNQPENNYTAWLNAALCCVYAAQGDNDSLVTVLERPGGIRRHIEIAIQGDGLEFEGSVYYHVFVLRAYLIAAEMLERIGLDGHSVRGNGNRSIEGMLDVLASIADDGGRLPAWHDGPYGRVPYGREIVEIFEIGYTTYHKADYLRVLRFYYKELNAGAGRKGSLEALLYGADIGDERADTLPATSAETTMSKSCLLPDSGFAVLRQRENPLSVTVDFGPHGGSHGHYDKLNVMMDAAGSPLSPDRGTVPYGSELKKSWYPSTPCHNTLSINGRSQAETAGRCLAYRSDAEGSFISMSANDAYEGVTFLRHVAVTGDYVIDWVQVRMQEEGTIDWWFHFLGEMDLNQGNWERHDEPASYGDRDGYQYVRGIAVMREQAMSASGDAASAVLQIRLDGLEQPSAGAAIAKPGVTAALIMPARTELSYVSSPGIATDPSVPMNGILLRQVGRETDIVAVYRFGLGELKLEWEPCAGADEGRILRVMGDAGNKTYKISEVGIKELNG
jgi:hypothetical protein